MSVESLQCPIVVMWRCNVLTSLQWLLSRPILGTGLWATFCSNVPQREVSPLLQTRGCMLVQAYSGGQDGRRKINSVVQQLAALLSLRIEIKQQPFEFPKKKKKISVPPHKAGGNFVALLTTWLFPRLCFIESIDHSLSAVPSLSLPLSYLSSNRRSTHTDTHTRTHTS